MITYLIPVFSGISLIILSVVWFNNNRRDSRFFSLLYFFIGLSQISFALLIWRQHRDVYEAFYLSFSILIFIFSTFILIKTKPTVGSEGDSKLIINSELSHPLKSIYEYSRRNIGFISLIFHYNQVDKNSEILRGFMLAVAIGGITSYIIIPMFKQDNLGVSLYLLFYLLEGVILSILLLYYADSTDIIGFFTTIIIIVVESIKLFYYCKWIKQ